MPGSDQSHLMQCMEIWGGNRAISGEVAMAGLDVRVYSKPYRAADGGGGGGDIHYLSSCASGRSSRMIVADVSGHGEGVSAIATSLRRLMGKFSNYIDQSRFMEAVNARFGELREQDEQFSGLFATAVVATYFSPTDELSICNAGHPRPLHYSGASGQWSAVTVDAGSSLHEAGAGAPRNLPLGVLDDAAFDQFRLHLDEGDLVLAYTDALLEVVEPGGRQLGEEGLIAMVGRIDVGQPAGFIDALRAALARYARGEPADGDASRNANASVAPYEFADDVTILVLGRNSGKARPSAALGATAAWRIAANAVRAATRRDVPLSLPQPSLRSMLGAALGFVNGPNAQSVRRK